MATEDTDIKRYYDELDEMFGTRGWKNLVAEAKSQLAEWKEIMPTLRSWDQVNELRGQMLQLARIINLEEVTDLMRQQAADEAADADL
jgi:hypothetical protein